MRFLVDENAGPSIARWLREKGHDVFSIYDSARGLPDDDVIRLAFTENRILITSDKDFGTKVYRERRPHHGVVLLSLRDERLAVKRATLERLLVAYAERLPDHFVVASERRVRFARR
jgi:predicted nuclease of predicted toxin-antitoxin system